MQCIVVKNRISIFCYYFSCAMCMFKSVFKLSTKVNFPKCRLIPVCTDQIQGRRKNTRIRLIPIWFLYSRIRLILIWFLLVPQVLIDAWRFTWAAYKLSNILVIQIIMDHIFAHGGCRWCSSSEFLTFSFHFAKLI